MKSLKKLLVLATVLAFASSSVYAADEYESYEESSSSPYIAPAIALGTIGAVALVAVLVQNSGGGHHKDNDGNGSQSEGQGHAHSH